MNTHYDFLVSMRMAEAQQAAARERLARQLRLAAGSGFRGLADRLFRRTPVPGDEFGLAA